MNTEQNKIRKAIREHWQSLRTLAWEYSDRFDLIRSWLKDPEDEASISQLSGEEKTLRSYVLGDIPKIRDLVRQGKDIQLNTRDYHIGREMLDFQNGWHGQQEDFFGVLIDGFSYSVVKHEDIPWFTKRLDATTVHQRKQFQSLIDGINRHISTEFSRAKVAVKDTPELKSAHQVLIEVTLKKIKLLEEGIKKASQKMEALEAERKTRLEAEKRAYKYEKELSDSKKRLEEEALVREEAEKKVEFYTDRVREIEREPVAMAYGRKETEEKALQGQTGIRAENTTKLCEYLEQQLAEAAWGGPLTIENLRTQFRILIQAFEQD